MSVPSTLTYRATARSGRVPAVVGIVLLAITLACAALVLVVPPAPRGTDVLIAAVVVVLGLLLCLGLLRLRLAIDLDASTLHLRGGLLFGRALRVPRSQIRAARAGYHLDGVGFGWGRRHEGAGDTMLRAGGPEVTLLLEDDRRLAFSVPDPDALLTALGAPSADVSRQR
ncbi:hypothetical protein DEO23_14290 [Brachybacterium endophyticum]|uniref:Bacterial Pleckstrin homology domain-containing protein n=1 Tax=Brachybacterium endophyticum TaxID=2182385 RepID=A0A2U2RH92_9MICO|nr:hypothetical protein [Brachybacterium endophyticum]PWH05242.1 hypothetical protein DEO23_14290 [Brachybacterium endophyticum]